MIHLADQGIRIHTFYVDLGVFYCRVNNSELFSLPKSYFLFTPVVFMVRFSHEKKIITSTKHIS